MFKFKISQLVHYIKDDKPHSAKVLSRVYVDNGYENVSNGVQDEFFHRFGDTRIMYSTCHGEFHEHELAASKQELAELIFSG